MSGHQGALGRSPNADQGKHVFSKRPEELTLRSGVVVSALAVHHSPPKEMIGGPTGWRTLDW